jgi:hypothetical protein
MSSQPHTVLPWVVRRTRLPLLSLRCVDCRSASATTGEGRFRVNANGKLLDVWLLVRCVSCDRTSKLAVHERTPVRSFDRAELHGYHVNDPELVASRLLDPVPVRPERLIAQGLGLSRNEVLRRIKCSDAAGPASLATCCCKSRPAMTSAGHRCGSGSPVLPGCLICPNNAGGGPAGPGRAGRRVSGHCPRQPPMTGQRSGRGSPAASSGDRTGAMMPAAGKHVRYRRASPVSSRPPAAAACAPVQEPRHRRSIVTAAAPVPRTRPSGAGTCRQGSGPRSQPPAGSSSPSSPAPWQAATVVLAAV